MTSPSQKTIPNVAAVKIAIIAAQENRRYVDTLVRTVVQTCAEHQIDEEQLYMMWVPTLFHAPLVAKSIASQDFDGVIVLGVTFKDATDRYYMEGPEVYRALMDVMMDTGMLLSIGIVGGEDLSAVKRAVRATGEKNRGICAARDMIELLAK